LKFDKPTHIDIVCTVLKREPKEIWQYMLKLEMINAIEQLEGKMFIKKLEVE
jgi:hypothetical protein